MKHVASFCSASALELTVGGGEMLMCLTRTRDTRHQQVQNTDQPQV